MRYSEELYSQIKTFEGYHPKAYKGNAGVWVVGYGHTGGGIREGVEITEDMAETFLRADLEAVERALHSYKLPELTQGQWDAIVSFAFNLGAARFRSSVLYVKIGKNPQDKRIESEFLRWISVNGNVDRSLVKRRSWEAKRYFGTI